MMFQNSKTMLYVNDQGLNLAGKALLAKLNKNNQLNFEESGERILGLLSIAYNQPIPDTIADILKKAAYDWNFGRQALANIRLAHLRLPEIETESFVWDSVRKAEQAFEDGAIPEGAIFALMKGYNPDEPRDERGHWTTGDNNNNYQLQQNAHEDEPIDQRLEPGFELVGETTKDKLFQALYDILHPLTYKPTDEVPSHAVQHIAGDGTSFLVPPNANFKLIYAYGVNLSKNPSILSDAIPLGLAEFWGGIFDYQRSNHVFYKVYRKSANYGVGVLLRGAGYSQNETDFIASTFARLFSSTSNSHEMKDWWMRSWNDANAGIIK